MNKLTENAVPFPSGDGEVIALLHNQDWSTFPPGPPEQWPTGLATLVSTILGSKIPMLLAWGPELVSIYNDAYIQFLGDKHPWALGKPYSEIWSEIWPELAPVVAEGWAGKATFAQNALFTVRRHDWDEKIWATFSHSPVFDGGRVVGALAVGLETTEQVLADRVRAFQLALVNKLEGLLKTEEITSAAAELLGHHLRASRVFYAEPNPACETFDVMAAWAAKDLPPIESVARQSDFGEDVLAALCSGHTLVVDAVATHPLTAANAATYAALDMQSFLAVPLVKAGQLIAILNLSRAAPSHWEESDVRLIQEAAERTWSAVERARVEAALRAERDRSREILDNMEEGFVLLDRGFRVLQINPGGMRLERRPPSEIVGRTHWQAWPGSESSELGKAFKRAMAERISLTVESYYTYPDGRGVWLDVHAYPLHEGLALFYRDITERKRAEEELRRTAGRLQFTLEAAQIGDWDLDLIEDKAHRSMRHDQCFGYTEPIADWGFEKFIQHVHPDDREHVRQQFRQALERFEDWHFECRVIWPDGSVHWIAAHGSIYHSDTRPLRMSGIVFDITERKRLEQERHEAVQHLQLAVDLAQLGSWEWDVISGQCYYSTQWKKQLGYQADELGNSIEEWKSRLYPEDRERVFETLATFVAQPELEYRVEYRLRHRDGSYRWMIANAVTITDPHGKAVKMSGTQLDITESKLAEQRVIAAAQHDALTRLPNRALTFEWAAHVLAAARRNHGGGAFLFIDLDRFKPINDLYGHVVGDRLLQEVAKRLTNCVRHEDLVGRLGGDEFIIVLQHADSPDRVATVAQHVLDAMVHPFEIGSLHLSISASIGISHFPKDGSDVDALVHSADLAMYQAKHEGRGNYTTFTPELNDRADASSAIEARLKHALHRQSLMLHYQPVVDMKTGEVLGAEALLRLADEGEAIGPERFVPVAEAAGLIGEIGEWVVAEACRQHAAWRAQGLPAISIAINVSPLQFKQREFAQRLQRIMQSAHVDPSCIQIEVTESTVMGSGKETVHVLQHLRSAGIRIALDDFGTGYSSLSQLSNLPLDKLKVDQSFVRSLGHDKPSRAIIEAVIALGRTLRLQVVGEGIESEDALAYLQEHGCDQAQGYFISPPLGANDFAAWYRQKHL